MNQNTPEEDRQQAEIISIICGPRQTESEGAELIAAERQRQIQEEGWSPEGDDSYTNGQLARAAACYALPEKPYDHFVGVRGWPWQKQWWKPTPNDRVRELVKAGALIAAEIDRLQRLASPDAPVAGQEGGGAV